MTESFIRFSKTLKIPFQSNLAENKLNSGSAGETTQKQTERGE